MVSHGALPGFVGGKVIFVLFYLPGQGWMSSPMLVSGALEGCIPRSIEVEWIPTPPGEGLGAEKPYRAQPEDTTIHPNSSKLKSRGALSGIAELCPPMVNASLSESSGPCKQPLPQLFFISTVVTPAGRHLSGVTSMLSRASSISGDSNLLTYFTALCSLEQTAKQPTGPFSRESGDFFA